MDSGDSSAAWASCWVHRSAFVAMERRREGVAAVAPLRAVAMAEERMGAIMVWAVVRVVEIFRRSALL